jgi:hypothetical protein
MWARVVERHHRLRAPAIDDLADALANRCKRLIPTGALEMARAAGADPLQRIAQATAPVDELLAAAGHLVADHSLRIGKGLRSTYLNNPPVLDGQLKAAGVGAVQGTNAGAINGAHCRGFHTNRGVGIVRCICRKCRQLLGREQISCQEWPKPDCRRKRALACNCWGPICGGF